jgi:hypothetical protein
MNQDDYNKGIVNSTYIYTALIDLETSEFLLPDAKA